MYFDDKDSSLKDLVILEPQFLTDLLSSIITTKHTFVKDGVLQHKVSEYVCGRACERMRGEIMG